MAIFSNNSENLSEEDLYSSLAAWYQKVAEPHEGHSDLEKSTTADEELADNGGPSEPKTDMEEAYEGKGKNPESHSKH